MSTEACQTLLSGSSVLQLWPQPFTDSADQWLRQLTADTPWRQDQITLYGKTHPLPRQQAWYGDAGCEYRYSGLHLQPLAWTPTLNRIRQTLEHLCAHRFNAALLNYYRNGNDRMGWHSDSEPELGLNPVIAIVSLGAARELALRRNDGSDRMTVSLPHGSLLVMNGAFQHHWQHALPVRKRISEPRLSLTFRYVHSAR